MKSLKEVSLVILLLSIITGCSIQKPLQQSNSKIEQLGEMRGLQITEINPTKNNHLLVIQATVTNLRSYNQELYYHFVWLDSKGFKVDNQKTWKHELLYAYQNKQITGVAPSPGAVDFKIVVQSPNNTGLLP